jgi:hypothetical protein
MGALFAVLVVLGTGFTAVMLAVAHDRMFTELAVAFRTVTDAFFIGHGADSLGSGRRRAASATRCTSVGVDQADT